MTTSSTADAVWRDRISALREARLERKMRVSTGPAGPEMQTPEGIKINFCSNDYLGLAADPELRDVAAEAFRRWGVGAGASRLVSGNHAPHEALESRVAEFMGTDGAVLFSSGYQANVGALSALTAEGDIIFSDQLVHASLVDGARLSKAEVRVFRHGDLAHLESLLAAARPPGLKLIVTDAVFSMDGDIADLPGMAALAETHNAAIYLDEAHALGVMGPGGRGLAAALGVADRIAVRLGTFSKSAGISGAFVATCTDASALLKSTARSLLYSTAPPAAMAETIIAGLERVRTADGRRETLRRNVALFRELAGDRLPLHPSETPIQPIVTGTEARTMRASEALWRRGYFVQGIRPPTVPKGMSRLRITLGARHTEPQIRGLVRALEQVLAEDGP